MTLNRSGINLNAYATLVENIGTGTTFFAGKCDVNTLQFKSLSVKGNGISISEDNNNIIISGETGTTSSINWGDITGSISNQTDLQNTFLKLDQTTPQNVSGGAPQFDEIRFNTNTGLTHIHDNGHVHWNTESKTLEVDLFPPTVNLQVGQEMHVLVKNVSGSLIENGEVVYPNGAEDGKPTIELAEAALTRKQVGVATHDIPNGEIGIVTVFGKVHYLDTSAYSPGTLLFVGITPGEFTDTPPPPPYNLMNLGLVLVQDSINGVIIVDYKPAHSFEELSNVNNNDSIIIGNFPVWNGTYYDTTTNIGDYVLKSTYSGFTGTTNLQTVTEIGSITNIESTFNSGIKSNKISSLTDSVSGITINKSDGNTPIININTSSGFTGFGINPDNLLHTYGIDDSCGDLISTHKNGIKIDGVSGGDKSLIWADNNKDKWFAEIYRNEEGQFWYLYNEDADISPITVSESGRVGINSVTNIIDYPPTIISGTSRTDLNISGLYNKSYIQVYQIKITDNVSIPNKYSIRISKDLGLTFSNWSTSVNCSTGTTIINGNVEISFNRISGFSNGETWQFNAFPQLAPATFAVDNNRINKALLTLNYTENPINYNDYTAEINTSVTEKKFYLFNTGTTLNAGYIGTNIKLNSIFVNLIEGGEGIVLVVEYWDGDSWVNIEVNNEYYLDSTNNLKNSGIITWNINEMGDWVKSSIKDYSDEYYWLRFRTSTTPIKPACLGSITRGSKYRFITYTSPFDIKPSFYVDALGRTSIGGGIITGNNKFQINNQRYIDETIASPSIAELDSNDPQAADLRIKLTSNDAYGTGIAIVKTRGELNASNSVQTGDELGHIWFRARVGTTGATLNSITSEYTGDGNTDSLHGDLKFNTANGNEPIERVRITNSGTTGFGIDSPKALIHLQSGTTTIPPLRFNSGSLLTSPKEGVVEFDNQYYYGTISGNTRKTFAFLENPEFTGTVLLPSDTIFNNNNLNNYILNSGGTNNDALVKTNDFNTYTGDTETTIIGIENDINYISGVTDTKLDSSIFNTYTGESTSWSDIDFTNSDLADLETKNASDVDISIPNWDSTNMDDIIQKILEYNEDILITGRIEPEDVLFGKLTNTLIVSGGSGYINYEGFHKKITWSGTTADTTGYVEGIYYVYVDSNGDVNIVNSKPNSKINIVLGSFYHGGFIGVIQQNGTIVKSSMNGIVDSLIRQGIFIYDNGGEVKLLEGDELRIGSSAAKIQYGLLSIQLPERSSYDATEFTYLNYFKSGDFGWALNYYFNNVTNGETPVNRWNNITKNSEDQYSGFTFTYGSNIVTGNTGITISGLSDTFIYLTSDGDPYMTPVLSATTSGSTVIITLETPYYGSGGIGDMIVNSAIPKIPSGKYTKNLVIRSSDGLMYYILGEILYDTEEDAINGVLPQIPESLINYAIKMAYIITTPEMSSLSGNIYDIRPLPYQFREGGQVGGGSITTIHGNLGGLDADDHLQYLRTDGTRNLTGIQKYQTQPTFTTDLDIITKKYVDDGLELKLNSTTFNTFTGTTLPDNYYNKTEINNYTGDTDIRLNDIENDINYISGITDTKLDNSIFNTFTGTTLPNNYYDKTEIDSYTAQTQTEINNRLLISDFDYYTGTTAPVTYLTINNFNTYSAETKNIIDAKAYLSGATFTGEVRGVTPTVNDNSTCFATTEYYINQAANTNPLMDGNVAIGTLNRFARQDHVHPTDTSRFAVTGGTITGSVNITGNLGVSGITTLSATTIGSGLAKYDADYSGIYDNRTLVDKEFVDTHPLAVQTVTNAGTATTINTIDTLLTGMQITGVPTGDYLLSFGTSFYNNTNGAFIYTTIYVNGTAINGTLQGWKRGNQDIQATHNYANFPLTLTATSTVEIRWRTTAGTASSSNRYLTLLKTDTLI